MSGRALFFVAPLLLALGCAAGSAGPAAAPTPQAARAWRPRPIPEPLPGCPAQELGEIGGSAVVLIEDHRAPLFELRIEWPAGDWSPWLRRRRGEDAVTIQLHDRAGALRRAADELAATVRLLYGEEHSELRLGCLKEDAEACVRLASAVLTGRDFDGRELRVRRFSRPATWAATQLVPEKRIRREAALRVYGAGDPRRRFAEPPDAVETDPARLLRTREALLRLPGRVVAFAGDLQPEEARRLAAALALPPVEPPPADLAPRLPPLRAGAGGDEAVTLPRLNQAYLAMYRDAPGQADPDYPAFLLANWVLTGHMRSRLTRSLRVEGATTYAVTGERLEDFAPGLYGIYTYTAVADAAAIEARLRRELRRFREGGISEAERAEAADALRGELPRLRETPRQLLSRYLRERRHGVPGGWQDQLVERAAALPLGELNAFVRRFYDPARLRLLTLRPGR